MPLADLDRLTIPALQLKDVVAGEIYGFDGTLWRPLSVDATGAIIVSGGVIGVATDIQSNTQIQNIETTVALAGNTTFTGGDRDCIQYEGFAYSVFVIGGGVGTNIDIAVQHRATAAATYRDYDRVAGLVVGAGASVHLEKIFGITRRFQRIVCVNNSANAVATLEICTVQKPIA